MDVDNELLEKVLTFINELEAEIKKSTVPICFHCGKPYERDAKYCNWEHNTWKPGCDCISKPTIRIVTGSM